MDFTPLRRAAAWFKALDARTDAWAARRLSPEEYAEAVQLDRDLKKNFWRWLGRGLAAVAALTLAFWFLAPSLGWWRALFLANIVCGTVVGAFIAAWYGYRRCTGTRARRSFIFFASLLAGIAFTGAIVGWLGSGKPLAALTPDKIMRILGVVMLLAGSAMAILAAIANLRRRDVEQRMALLEGEAERERLARQGVQAELKLLQAQVEPHFLFNTLANLRYLVQSGSPDALRMLDHLIHYLRTALPEIRAEGSTLGREAELARAYLEIMRLRMGGSLEVSIDLPAELGGKDFPALMLMTLVENAVKHGVAPMGRGHIAIGARVSGDRIRVEVADDGRGLVEPIGQGVGLANVRERLRAIHGNAARLELVAREPAGTLAVIEVPA